MCPSKNERAKDNKNKESRKWLKRKLSFLKKISLKRKYCQSKIQKQKG